MTIVDAGGLNDPLSGHVDGVPTLQRMLRIFATITLQRVIGRSVAPIACNRTLIDLDRRVFHLQSVAIQPIMLRVKRAGDRSGIAIADCIGGNIERDLVVSV